MSWCFLPPPPRPVSSKMKLRLEKFSSLVKKQLALILLDYQSARATISVNSIKISPDLKIAHAFIAVWGEGAEQIFAVIQKDRGRISRALANKLKSKFSPSLQFHLDTGQTEAEKIQKLLD